MLIPEAALTCQSYIPAHTLNKSKVYDAILANKKIIFSKMDNYVVIDRETINGISRDIVKELKEKVK